MAESKSGQHSVSLSYTGPEARLDRVLAQHLDELGGELRISRSQVKNAIEEGSVRVAGKSVTKAGAVVRGPVKIEASFEIQGSNPELVPLDTQLSILFEDSHIIVINKPAGLTMHPGAGNHTNTLANALVHHWNSTGIKDRLLPRAGIVHRLDKDTTGIVVVAKTIAAHEILSKQFAERSVGRSYLALAQITPRSALFTPRGGGKIFKDSDGSERMQGVIDAPLARHPKHRTKMAVVKEGGRRAVTNWIVVDRFDHGVLLQLKLETGRTHQIRVHLAHYGAPIIGDTTYGRDAALPHKLRIAAEGFGRQALHAFKLEFSHPHTQERLRFESPTPEDMQRLITLFQKETAAGQTGRSR